MRRESGGWSGPPLPPIAPIFSPRLVLQAAIQGIGWPTAARIMINRADKRVLGWYWGLITISGNVRVTPLSYHFSESALLLSSAAPA